MLDVTRRPRLSKEDVDNADAETGDVKQGRLILVDLAGTATPPTTPPPTPGGAVLTLLGLGCGWFFGCHGGGWVGMCCGCWSLVFIAGDRECQPKPWLVLAEGSFR